MLSSTEDAQKESFNCPEGFVEHKRRCYGFFVKHYARTTWVDAQKKCRSFNGGDLVSILTKGENDFIAQKVLISRRYSKNESKIFIKKCKKSRFSQNHSLCLKGSYYKFTERTRFTLFFSFGKIAAKRATIFTDVGLMSDRSRLLKQAFLGFIKTNLTRYIS